MKITPRAVVGAALLALLLPLAACGSDSDGGSAGVSAPKRDLAEGSPADSSLEPVTIGFQSALNGAFALPDVKTGFDAGLKFVNERLGGVDGHPLEAVTCGTDGTPDASVDCGNQFVQKKVVLSTLGFDFGADAILPVLKGAGIAEYGYQAITPGLNSAVGQAFFTLPSQQESFSSDLVMHDGLGADSLASVLPDVPSMHDGFDNVIKPAADKLGLKVKAFYYPTPTDWASFAATVLSTNPSAVTVYAPDSDTLAAIPAFRGAGFTGVIDASTSTSIINKLPAATLDKVVFTTQYFSDEYAESALSDKVAADLAAFNTYVKPTDKTIINYAQIGFYLAVQAADALRQIAKATGEPLTAASVLENLPNTKGSMFFRDSTYDCSAPTWPGTTSCSEGLYYAEVDEDGKLTPLENSPIDVSEVRPAS